MKLGAAIQSLLEDPQKWSWIKRIFYASLLLVVAADFLIPRHHIFFFWDQIPGFGALYGLFSCVLIIVFSKWLGHYWLMKRENYYD